MLAYPILLGNCCEEVLGYEINPFKYNSCATESASLGWILILRYASVCKVVKSNGVGGACLNCVRSILLMLALSLCCVTFLNIVSASSFFQNLSLMCRAMRSGSFWLLFFSLFPFNSICQNGSGLNALISFSLSTIVLSAGPCTRPAERTLNAPAARTARLSARERLMP